MARIRDAPLFWKILLPFLMLVLIVGSTGAFLIVNDQASRAQAALDQDLAQRALQGRALLHDRELYLLESANFAANTQGMAAAVSTDNSQAAARLLQSVRALKTELDLVVVTNARGVGVSESIRPSSGAPPNLGTGTAWTGSDTVQTALKGATSAGFLTVGDLRMVAVATPICSEGQACKPVGVAVVGVAATGLAHQVQLAGTVGGGVQESVALFDLRGNLVASTGRLVGAPPAGPGSQMVRQTTPGGSNPITTIYAPFALQGRPAGQMAIAVPVGAAFAAVRGVALRLALLLLAAMAGIVGIGALMSRFLLAQVRPLVATNRALGAGHLSARAPVLGHDELGELAQGVNQMAEQLQASYETLEMRVDERTQEVRRLLRDRTEFFASLSHELRTPLAVVIHQADMLLENARTVDPELAVDVGRTVRESATQLLSRVNDILELAKAESGGVELDMRPVDVAAMIRDLTPTIRGLTQRANLTARFQVPAGLPPVRADQARLRQVLMNLVDNAVKYTPAGGLVAVRVVKDDDRVEIAVLDTGVGIPAEEGERIFEPFHRVKGTSTQNGQPSSGLGLALAKTWVTAHGGTIRYESVPGQGSTFVVSLDALPRQAATPPGSERRPSRARDRKLVGSKRS